MRLLDVATGTGLVARAAADILGSPRDVVAVDPSAGMMDVGRRLLPMAFVRGLAEALPFSEEWFDFVTMGYALRHVPDLVGTFREFRRVLRPGGRLVILEIAKPTSRLGRAAARTYMGRVVPWLTRLTTSSADAERMMRYYWETIAGCVPAASIVEALGRADLCDVRLVHYTGMIVEYHARRA
jgi:demethylmenaquinone methyltransferase/2-methoxy-6-polyprenyl-1,4-benzoquinol methylase